MKKILLSVFILFLLAGCKNEPSIERETFESMGTVIEVNIYDKSNKEYKHVKDIFDLYSQITSNFKRNEVSKDSPHYGLENIYTINQNAGVKSVVVTKELIDILKYSKELHDETEGYFNIGIGHTIDKWKELIDDNKYNLFIRKDEYDQTLNEVNELALVDLDDLVINEGAKTVYLKNDSIKLDLGAISKGYATQKAYEYLQKRGVKKFKINSGNSSISAGLHKEKRKFNIGISDDNKIYEHNLLGIVKFENKHLSTSGTSQQHVDVYDDENNFYTKVHHIVSPFSLRPENNYYKISLLGDDAGMLDAYSTVVFLMSEEEGIAFLKDKEIGYILYLFDNSIETNLSEDTFQQFSIVRNVG